MRHLVGITVVVLAHVALIALIVSIKRTIDKPPVVVEAKIVEEQKPPPPPEIKLPPPPKLQAPPPPFIPPPEVTITTPPPPVAVNVTSTAPPPSQTFVPTSAAPAPPAPPAPRSIAVACPNVRDVAKNVTFPPRALKAGVTQGTVRVRFVVTASGAITSPEVTYSSNKMLNEAALSAVSLLQCKGEGQDQAVSWEIGFTTE